MLQKTQQLLSIILLFNVLILTMMVSQIFLIIFRGIIMLVQYVPFLLTLFLVLPLNVINEYILFQMSLCQMRYVTVQIMIVMAQLMSYFQTLIAMVLLIVQILVIIVISPEQLVLLLHQIPTRVVLYDEVLTTVSEYVLQTLLQHYLLPMVKHVQVM